MGSYFSIGIDATENSVDVANNRSSVTVNLRCYCSGCWADDGPVYWIKVDGSEVKRGTRNFNYEDFTISWTGYVNHNADGTKTISYQGFFQGCDKQGSWDTTTGDTTGVKYLTLTPIATNNIRINTNSGWKSGKVYINTSSGWKTGDIYVKTSDGWKKGS